MEEYTVLSPWAAVDLSRCSGINSRLPDLNGKTIGLYAHFKDFAVAILDEIATQLKERFPEVRFSSFQYLRETVEIEHDPDNFERYKQWLSGVDIVITGFGDRASCAMFLAYNTVIAERLGKPAVMIADKTFSSCAHQGASARLMPALRVVDTTLSANDGSAEVRKLGEAINMDVVRRKVALAMPNIIAALTTPTTDEEKQLPRKSNEFAEMRITGTITQLSDYFYKRGWTNGTPIIPPTEELVSEMIAASGLPRDHVVAEIPPMMGQATIEKIAVNAVMAGCLPTYMPVLIAAVKGAVDPRIALEGWTCSRSSWAPFIIISGPVRKAIGLNAGAGLLSAYTKASSTIAKAFAYIIMNISGVRANIEDKSSLGHEARFGVCFGENDVESPWPPLQSDFGMNPKDSAVTLFWPMERFSFHTSPTEVETFMEKICSRDDGCFDPGCCFIISPTMARGLQTKGWSKENLLDYILEYARKPYEEVNVNWLIGNNHLPKDVPIPVKGPFTARRYWSKDHIFVVVASEKACAAFMGGGDHGGPSCTKIELPSNWDDLVEKYSDLQPDYILY